MSQDTGRLVRLSRALDGVLLGKTPVTKRNYLQFLEAIVAQTDPPSCLNKLFSSPQGVPSIQAAMRFDVSVSFLNGPATEILIYLSCPELPSIGSGEFLKRILLAIVDPPYFFSAFVDAFRAYRLDDKAHVAFAWLLLQLVLFTGTEEASTYLDLGQDPKIIDPLLASAIPEVRAYAEKVKHVVQTRSVGDFDDAEYGPGGRHDNDKPNFREIAIIPTADEITSKQAPFMRKSVEIENSDAVETRVADYLDNHFRLLREDMIYEIREELQKILDNKRKSQRVSPIDGLRLASVHYTIDQPAQQKWKTGRWSVLLRRASEFPHFVRLSNSKRKDWLRDNRRFLKHRSLACILREKVIIAFATIDRNEDLLAESPNPVIVLQFEGESNTVKALMKMKDATNLTLVPVDTAVFAYEPILKTLQNSRTLPLSEEMLFWDAAQQPAVVHRAPTVIENLIRQDPAAELQDMLQTPKSIKLDPTQSNSFLAGLTQAIAIIQGPPGTGKSFIGALLAKALLKYTNETILVVCYKNHALDQFLEELLDNGVSEELMLRLGGKSTSRTESMSLFNIIHGSKNSNFKFTRADWTQIDELKRDITAADTALTDANTRFMNTSTSYQDIMELIEFEDQNYYYAFKQEPAADGMARVTKKGKPVGATYLIDQWISGWDAGLFKNDENQVEAAEIWRMPHQARQRKYDEWRESLLKEQAERISTVAVKYNDAHVKLHRKYEERNLDIIRSRRLIACTTTAAAMYRHEISAAAPDIVIVEEACEILESHIITALAENTKQLIMIGDHKQLRPKVNSYTLNVDSHEGFDLNRSLFERLVRRGFPHHTLGKQHRMRPEISRLVRALTYPDLIDAPSTLSRPDLRGVQDNVVFIHHELPEDDHEELQGFYTTNESTSKASKRNNYEVEMILMILRYLGQQGYGTDQIVILTPYLGQLRAIQDALKGTTDAILNDLDSADLVRAGLITAAAASVSKKSIRLATIDNYQGEESEIILASLTRSNPNNSIGFMASPERVNVLLSRARNALIMIGNAHTFQHSRTGKETWTKLFGLLRQHGHIYNGLPVRCERHPTRTTVLSSKDDFEQYSPDGGCSLPCAEHLKCGHSCPSKCHQVSDHSQMQCEEILYSPCVNNHKRQYHCFRGPPANCIKCDRDAKMAARRQQQEFERQERMDREARQHADEMSRIDAEIAQEREKVRQSQLDEERMHALEQKKKDLQDARALAERATGHTTTPSNNKRPGPDSEFALPVSTKPNPPDITSSSPSSQSQVQPSDSHVKGSIEQRRSSARDDWERQKTIEGDQNDAIDAIMELVGLESVKTTVLDIKTTVDTAQRQGISLKDRRFNVCMLGNPGTGKTTVARLYGKFLASVQVIPGNVFVETTGSRLANEGVTGVKKTVEKIIEDGGGTLFCDEAYQLTGQHNFQGGQVLDFLLAEMENNVGKLVFIFAGYTKEMERFFEHNPGLPSRVPYNLRFDDYSDEEFLDMLDSLTEKKFHGRMKVDEPDGIRGLSGRVAIRRLGAGRGRNGFGNARALHNMFTIIHERQGKRLKKERASGQDPDDLLFCREDIIGPDPSTVMTASNTFRKLQAMIGLQNVKNDVLNLVDMIKRNYQRELLEQKPLQISLNRVFLGPPGTGKTTVAKYYGRILAELGLLSNGEVVVKSPADFIGSALGQSESQTKAILQSTVGKVLVIDEAYMLYSRSSSGSAASDPYKTAVIDTIVAEVQSTPGEDRCVLLLGYRDQMEEMFRNVNQGLSRRFALQDAFLFENYSDGELLEALNMKLADQDLVATPEAKKVAIECLSRSRMQVNFGNIGEVENLLRRAKLNMLKRQSTLPDHERLPNAPIEPEDFDPDYARGASAGENLKQLFSDVVGCENVITSLAEYQKMAQTAQIRGRDPRDLVPTNFIFKGPPGTGKTTTARKMGQVYYDMGMLSSNEVIECSATDLIGEYVGQTGPKTRQLFERALGRVLFVDEAYRLAEGHFAKEAMDELVGILTDERFRAKLIVVLAGYDQEMDHLMSVNTGLSSRFQKHIYFEDLKPDQALEILRHALAKEDVQVDALAQSSSSEYAAMSSLIQQLSGVRGWGNARDIKSLSKEMIATAYRNDSSAADPTSILSLPDQAAISCIQSMLAERTRQASSASIPKGSIPAEQPVRLHDPRVPATAPITHTSQSEMEEEASPQPTCDSIQIGDGAMRQGRDPGVTDAVWAALEADRLAEARQHELDSIILAAAEQEAESAVVRDEEASRILNYLLEQEARDDAGRAELMRQREQARLASIREREARARAEAERKAQREAEAARRKEEARVQSKLRQLGVCVAGFRWIKQSQGYRCAGGSHFVDNAALGL